MFSSRDIADYYNQTMDHYAFWWKLKETGAVHYGYWDAETRSFPEALLAMNREMAQCANIHHTHRVLDAGCGVGGSAFYLASTMGCKVSGITLSEKQLHFARERKAQFERADLVDFSLQNFSATNFPDKHFDIIWACESSCYADPKTDFLREAYRLLKPGGRLIVCDYFLTEKGELDAKHYIRHWGELWAIQRFHTEENFIASMAQIGFRCLQNRDLSAHIMPSAKRMYHSYVLGALPSRIYNLFHRTSRFGKNHYQSGLYQYRAIQQELWRYRMVLAEKV